MDRDNDIAFFARTNGRHPHRTFGIRARDRLYHLYVIGRTGTGKTTLLEHLVRSDIEAGRGCALIDPHGDLAVRVRSLVPEDRQAHTVYWDIADPATPYGYNPLRRVRADLIPLAVSGLMEALKKHFKDAWGVRMEHILRYALYALIEYGEATLPDVLTMLFEKEYRREVLLKVENEAVRTFWEVEYPKLNPLYRKDAVAPIQNKIGAFLADPRLYRILTDTSEQLSFRRIMDEGKVLIVNLAKGRVGEDSADLLGALVLSTIAVAAMSRAALPEDERRPFFLTIDEFQSYTTLSVANMISELRKYKVGLTLAHQHLDQLEPEVRHTILANVGSLVSFRIGPEDAPVIAKELHPFEPLDFVNLPTHDIALRLMIDGTASRPFSGRALGPLPQP
jgi:DNA helicase HerA-like ATPase